jgi:hypothetical protein
MIMATLRGSVADSDPFGFGPPGSGPDPLVRGSRSFYHKAKKKTLISTVL